MMKSDANMPISIPPFSRKGVDGEQCRVCLQAVQSESCAVCVTVPSKHLQRLSAKTRLALRVQWDLSRPVNHFHQACWAAVMREDENEDQLQNKNKDTKKRRERGAASSTAGTTVSVPKGKTSSVERNVISKTLDTLETFQSLLEVQEAARKVLDLIAPPASPLEPLKIVCFTGAGISVSSGLKTYRGTDGIDTLEELAVDPSLAIPESEVNEEVDISKLSPTFTHYALVEMHKNGKMAYCATQNCDNLHCKAGFPRDHLSDLHGNVFIEYCEKCRKEYVRPYEVDVFSTDAKNEKYYVECATCGWNHFTGRKCSCKGRLRDTIVNFGDLLHDGICGGLDRATDQCTGADVCICLGTSLAVYPANDLPLLAKHLVIVNLQQTDMHNKSAVNVFCTTDNFFSVLLPMLRERLESCDDAKKKVSQDSDVVVVQTKKRVRSK